jgi:hypothetical protein
VAVAIAWTQPRLKVGVAKLDDSSNTLTFKDPSFIAHIQATNNDRGRKGVDCRSWESWNPSTTCTFLIQS